VAVNPESELIPVARSHGVTVVATVPSGGLISGLGAAFDARRMDVGRSHAEAWAGAHCHWPSDGVHAIAPIPGDEGGMAEAAR